jgi:hypothetical protein
VYIPTGCSVSPVAITTYPFIGAAGPTRENEYRTNASAGSFAGPVFSHRCAGAAAVLNGRCY